MAGDQHPQRRPEQPNAASVGWAALGYLIAGMAVWGLAGWLADHWLKTHGIAIGVGVMVGAAGGIYLVMRRLGA
jgi:F0F1-type ATP synthase assembly protein I